MFERMRQLLAAPVFEDEEKTRLAGWLHTILLATFTVALVPMVFTLLFSRHNPNWVSAFGLSIAVALSSLGLLFVVRRGFVRLASVLLLVILWCVITLRMFMMGTIRFPITGIYMIGILGAGLLFEYRGAFVFTLASIGATFGAFYAESNGLIAPLSVPISLGQWSACAAALVLTAILIRMTTRSLKDALVSARREIAERKRVEEELRAHRLHLEGIVAERTAELTRVNAQLQQDIVERERTEAALAEKTMYLDNILRSATEFAIATTDLDFRITYYNPRAEQLFGYTAAQVLGETVQEMHTKEKVEPERFENAVENVRTHGEHRYTVVQESDAGTRYIASRVSGICDVSGELVGFALFSHDVTERRRAEEAIVRAKEEWERTFDALSDLVLILDDQYRILRVNKAVADRLGVAPQDLVGQICYELLHGTEEPPPSCPYAQLLLDGQVHTAEKYEEAADGYFLVTVSPIRDADGQLLGSVHIARDITARKQAEEALRQAHHLLETIFDHTHMMIAYLDPQFNFIRVNRAYAQVDERDPSFFPGRNHFDLYPNEENEAIFRKAVETGQSHFELAQPFEYAEHPARGVSYWDWSLVPVRDVGGATVGLLLTLLNVTERVQAEAETFRLATMIEQAPVAIVTTDLEGNIDYVNPCFEAITGYTVEEALGQNPRVLKSGLHDAAFYQELWEAITAGHTWKGVFVNKRKDGSLYHEAATIFPVKTPSGEIINYAAVKRDITAQVRAEAALRESEEKYRTLVDTVDDLVFTVDLKGNILFVNPSAKRFAGWEPEEAMGHNYAEYVHPDDLPRMVGSLQRALSGEPVENIPGIGQDFEHRMVKRDGEIIWVSTNSQPLRDSQGHITSFSGISRDITERKRAEEERERLLVAEREQRERAEASAAELRSRERYLVLLNDITRAALETPDLQTMLQTLADRLGELLNADGCYITLWDEERQLTIPSAAYGPLRETYPIPHSKLGEVTMTESVLRAGHALVAEDVFNTPYLSPRIAAKYPTCSLLGLPLIAGEWKLGAALIGFDEPHHFALDEITRGEQAAGQVALALAKARLYEDLQRRMEELQNTQTQLIQSANLAAIGRLAAGVAHELNNPLQSVLGFAELLMMDMAPDDPIREDLAIITVEARRARDIVRGLLKFSRQTESPQERADVNQVMRDTLALLRQQIENSGVTLEENYAADLPLLMLAVGRVQQVFLNLITNALLAMPQGGSLTISSRRAGDEMAVGVADTGVGIPADHLPHIFEPFFTTRPVGQGTGLGLSVSLGIVQEHGGRIEIESQVDEGSTFTVWFPIAARR